MKGKAKILTAIASLAILAGTLTAPIAMASPGYGEGIYYNNGRNYNYNRTITVRGIIEMRNNRYWITNERGRSFGLYGYNNLYRDNVGRLVDMDCGYNGRTVVIIRIIRVGGTRYGWDDYRRYNRYADRDFYYRDGRIHRRNYNYRYADWDDFRNNYDGRMHYRYDRD